MNKILQGQGKEIDEKNDALGKGWFLSHDYKPDKKSKIDMLVY